jgi:AraC-like DNA-binding protein
MSSAPARELLWVTHARRSSRVRRAELQAPWGLCVPEDIGAAFHVVLRGACWLVSKAGAPMFLLRRGDLVLLPRGARHLLVDDPRAWPVDVAAADGPAPGDTARRKSGRSLLLSGGFWMERPLPLLVPLPEAVHVSAARCRRHGLQAIVDLLAAELDEGHPEAATVVPALADALLPLVVRAWLDDCAAGHGEDFAERSSDLVITASLERIHAEPERPWTVTDLAHEVALSRSAFAHRFSRAVGEPPHAYLARWRMTVAGRLLRDSDLKLAAVAHRVGYASEFAFAKAFKRDYGIAPGAYRRHASA